MGAPQIPRVSHIHVDTGVLLFALIVSTATGIGWASRRPCKPLASITVWRYSALRAASLAAKASFAPYLCSQFASHFFLQWLRASF